MPENKVLEKLNAVSTGKRLANMVRIQDNIVGVSNVMHVGVT